MRALCGEVTLRCGKESRFRRLCEPGRSENEGVDAVGIHGEFLEYRKSERDGFFRSQSLHSLYNLCLPMTKYQYTINTVP